MSSHDETNLSAMAWPLKIVCMALLGGVLISLSIFVYLVHSPDIRPAVGGIRPANQPVITIVVAIVAVGAVSIVATLPQKLIGMRLRELTVRQVPDSASVPYLLGAYQQVTILVFGLIEGACLAAGIAYLVEEEPAVLTIPALGIVYMIACFPTLPRIHSWLDGQTARLAELRTQS